MIRAKNNRTHTLEAPDGSIFYFKASDNGTTMTIRSQDRFSNRTSPLTTLHIDEARERYTEIRDGIERPGHVCG